MKDEKASFYGFKCFAIGYEFSPGLDEVRIHLSIAAFKIIIIFYMQIHCIALVHF